MEKANPSINGESKTKASKQDYRHGSPAVFWKGEMILKTDKNGRISQAEINKAIKERKELNDLKDFYPAGTAL